MRLPLQIAIAAVFGFGAVVVYNSSGSIGSAAQSLVALMAADTRNSNGTKHAYCNIKGDIERATGQRVYHVPGQESYADVTIDTRRGEAWFCSEKAAKKAGWSRANG